jgi:hypothetical protein
MRLCGPSCGSCDCPRVASTPGDDSSTRVRLTISHPTRTRRPSTDPARGQRDQGHGDGARVPAHPDRHARRPGAAARQGLGLLLDLVPCRAELRLAPPGLRVHPAKPKVGLRTTRASEMWHIETIVIRSRSETRNRIPHHPQGMRLRCATEAWLYRLAIRENRRGQPDPIAVEAQREGAAFPAARAVG